MPEEQIKLVTELIALVTSTNKLLANSETSKTGEQMDAELIRVALQVRDNNAFVRSLARNNSYESEVLQLTLAIRTADLKKILSKTSKCHISMMDRQQLNAVENLMDLVAETNLLLSVGTRSLSDRLLTEQIVKVVRLIQADKEFLQTLTEDQTGQYKDILPLTVALKLPELKQYLVKLSHLVAKDAVTTSKYGTID